MREKVTEGTSALFLLSTGEVLDRLQEELKGMDLEINLPKEQKEKLREAFVA